MDKKIIISCKLSIKKLYDTAVRLKQTQQFDIFSYFELNFSFYHTFRYFYNTFTLLYFTTLYVLFFIHPYSTYVIKERNMSQIINYRNILNDE